MISTYWHQCIYESNYMTDNGNGISSNCNSCKAKSLILRTFYVYSTAKLSTVLSGLIFTHISC